MDALYQSSVTGKGCSAMQQMNGLHLKYCNMDQCKLFGQLFRQISASSSFLQTGIKHSVLGCFGPNFEEGAEYPCIRDRKAMCTRLRYTRWRYAFKTFTKLPAQLTEQLSQVTSQARHQAGHVFSDDWLMKKYSVRRYIRAMLFFGRLFFGLKVFQSCTAFTIHHHY